MNEWWDWIRCNADALSAATGIFLAIGGVISIAYAGRMLRHTRNAIRHDAYQRIYSDYQFLIKHLIDHPDIRIMYKNRPKEFWFYEQMYDLLARVWRLRNKKMIDKDEWALWKGWLESDLVKHRLFQDVHERNRNYYPREFEKLVDGYLNSGV